MLRKGVECFKKMLDGLMDGVEINSADRWVVLDIIPNRRGAVE